ncbi:MAG: RraA family protein [Candidatus Thorarchaeota archaeon]|jgi:4-hydroxy-4-methyl-2-oxoglutarate aldolase
MITAYTDMRSDGMTGKRQAIIDRCMKLYVAAFSDAADEVGLGQVCMDSGIVPLTKNTRMAGFARTGRMVRSPPQQPYDEKQLERLMSLSTDAQNGDLLVIASGGADDCSVWGQVLTKIGIPKGIQGAIVDGTSRDIVEIDEVGFTVFARGRHPGTMRGRLDVESVNEQIVCGGVVVNPGDLIVADGDGVVVIPQDRIDEVLKHAEGVVDTDNWWSEKLDEGEDPHDLHKERPIP